MSQLIRLNKFLASVGITSRRNADILIMEGKVVVNGKVVKTLGTKVNLGSDEVLVDGERIVLDEDKIYILLNKPKGVLSTVRDEFGRKTVIDLVDTPKRIFPVGRLDEDSEGLILLTNDGELSNQLTHPKFHIPKKYEVHFKGYITPEKINALQQGIILKEGKTAQAEVLLVKQSNKGGVLYITLHQGWNRQIRRMCGRVDLEVTTLRRISFGELLLGDLPVGKHRSLTLTEVEKLKQKR